MRPELAWVRRSVVVFSHASLPFDSIITPSSLDPRRLFGRRQRAEPVRGLDAHLISTMIFVLGLYEFLFAMKHGGNNKIHSALFLHLEINLI